MEYIHFQCVICDYINRPILVYYIHDHLMIYLWTYLMPGSFFPVQLPLNGNGPFLTYAELTASVGDAIDSIWHFALAPLVRVSSFKCFQALADFYVFVHWHFNVGPFKLRFVVVDIAQFDDNPRVRDVIFVVIVVFALEIIVNRSSVTYR